MRRALDIVHWSAFAVVLVGVVLFLIGLGQRAIAPILVGGGVICVTALAHMLLPGRPRP